jgi:hypothetical protein
MKNTALQNRHGDSKMGIAHGIICTERLTRSEAIERDARFDVAGIYLADANDGNCFRLKAQTALRARLLPGEWASALESHGAAIWQQNRDIFAIFSEAGFARMTGDLLADAFASEERFSEAALSFGRKVLGAADQERLSAALEAHRAAFKRAIEFAESLLFIPRAEPFDANSSKAGTQPAAPSESEALTAA